MIVKTIKVDQLARVEGEGALKVVARDGVVQSAELNIFEPPRFFEAFLRDRMYSEAPDITARICGICPVAYQMSAIHAMENALGVVVDGPLRDLRRLLYCGEWIESHTLHVYMLHAPDFLGYAGAIEMARDHADIVRRGLNLKKAGNAIIALLGGREIHPINVRVGGFYRAPRRRELQPLAEELKRARDGALATVRWTAGFDFPDVERDYEFVALRGDGEYPFNQGRIVSSRGLDIAAAEYDEHFEESHVEHSTALHAHIKARGAYLTGPLARYALNAASLSPIAREAARERRDLDRSAPILSAALSFARSKFFTPATRRCASSTTTKSRSGLRSISSRAREPALRRPRRRAACCITATVSMPMERSPTPASSRRRRRTSRASKRI